MGHHGVKCFFTTLLEKAAFLFTELVYNLCQEIERVRLVLEVLIGASYNVDNLAHNVGRSEDLEKGFVFTELSQDGAGIECEVQVIFVLVRKSLDEGGNHHGALFLEHLLHEDLIGGTELRLLETVGSKHRLQLINALIRPILLRPG